MRIMLTVTLAAALLAPAAQAFTAINGLTVQATPGAGQFEVVARGSDGPRHIWCAAGQFARQVQNVGINDRIYIVEPYGPSRSTAGYLGVTFTSRPSAALADGPSLGTGGDYSVSIRKTGFNLRVGHAEGFCSDVYEKITEFWRH